ncbi:MAG: hypothetical protein OXC37_04820 [Bdellovibrionaceae bacterium]|nr:hypothetical protein [Pseudobdellovibrionaceae bacterium]
MKLIFTLFAILPLLSASYQETNSENRTSNSNCENLSTELKIKEERLNREYASYISRHRINQLKINHNVYKSDEDRVIDENKLLEKKNELEKAQKDYMKAKVEFNSQCPKS